MIFDNYLETQKELTSGENANSTCKQNRNVHSNFLIPKIRGLQAWNGRVRFRVELAFLIELGMC